MLKLGYKELFTDLDFEDQYPIELFSKTIPKLIGNSRDVIHLDFSGIDQLSDEVFYVLKNELKDVQKENVELVDLTGCSHITDRGIELVDLTGCSHITDRGIELLSEAFVNIKQLIIVGCTEVTQLSLNFLTKNCNKLNKLEASFTKICYVSKEIEDRWGNEFLKFNNLFKENIDKDEKNLQVNLVIVAMDPDIKCDIGFFLTTGKIRERDLASPILLQPNAMQINDTCINIIQLFCPTSYMAPFINGRSLFMIAVDMASEISNAFNIIKGLDFIRGVVYSAPVEVLALTTSDDKNKLDDLSYVLRSIFTEQSVNMKEHLEQEHYSRTCDKDFIDQWRYVQSLYVIKSDHLSLYVLGLNISVQQCDMCFYNVVCEPSNTEKIQQIVHDFSIKFINVKDSLDRINKSDISEVKSFNKLPVFLEKCFQSILIILKKTDSMEINNNEIKKYLNDPLFMTPLVDYNKFSDEDKPEEVIKILIHFFTTKEELEKNSRNTKLGTVMGLWLLLKWNFCERMAPIKKKSVELELLADALKDAKSSHQAICTGLSQNLLQLTNSMYDHSPSKLTQAMKEVLRIMAEESSFIVKVKDFKYKLPELSKSDLFLILDQLQRSGYLLFSKNVGLIIKDIPWFVDVLNTLLTSWTTPLNGDSVWFITSQAVMCSQTDLVKVLEHKCDDEMFKKVMIILQDYGLLLSVSRSWNEDPKNYEPLIEAETNTKTLVVSWHQLSIRPESNRLLVINQALEKSLPEIKIMKQVFPDHSLPEFLKDDISFKFSYKFRTGMPCNLFCQVVNKLVGQFRTILLWNQGIIIREGAVDVFIAHNIHASRGSSSIDIEARILGPVNGRRPVAVREHMWSVLSDILTIMEALIFQYPFLHHKLRHYCRGQCYTELGQENTFSQAEVSKNLNSNYFCNKCSEYQMSPSEWLYILGRQYTFPNHEIDKDHKHSCRTCWKHTNIIRKLWEYQNKIFPTFSTKLFNNNDKEFVQGNLIFSNLTPAQMIPHLNCSSNYLRSMDLKITDPKNVFIKLLDHHSDATNADLFCWKLEDGAITTSLLTCENVDIEEKCTRPLLPGESLQFYFHNDSEDSTNIMIVAINNLKAASYCLPESANIRFCIEIEPEESKTLKLIVSNIDAAIITSLYFRPGMIVLIKGETRWEPAVILEIKRGKLNCQPLSSLDKNALVIQPVNNKILSPNSVNILPPAFYPSHVNSTLNSKNLKALADSWYSIFEEYSDFYPTNFGLFHKLLETKSYSPLPIFGNESKCCNTSIFSPPNLLRAMFANPKQLASRASTAYLPLPFPLTPEKLLMPQRHTINHYTNHSLNRLCAGSQWKGYLRDMHPMNEEPYQMTEEQSRYFFCGDFSIDNFVIIKNFCSAFSAIYQNIDKSFPFIDPNINRDLLRDAIVQITKTYRDILIIDIASKIKRYDNLVLTMEKSARDLIKGFENIIKKTKQNKLNKQPILPEISKDSLTNSFSIQTTEEVNNIRKMLLSQQITCESHKLSVNVMKVSDLGSYNQCILNIMIKGVEMENVQNSSIYKCSRLRRLEIDFGTMPNTLWLQLLPRLSSLTLSNCNLSSIGVEFESFRNSLKQLCLSGNPIDIIPDFLCQFNYLDSLELNNTLISELPNDFGKLSFLKYLSIDHTKLIKLPQSFTLLKNLRTLRLSGIPPANLVNKKTGRIITKKEWLIFCKKSHINGCIFNIENSQNLFEDFVGVNNSLESSKNNDFELFLFKYFPRFNEFPIQILECTNLQSLIMPNQAFTTIPDEIQSLKQLKKVAFDGNLYLQTLSGYLGTLPLEVLSLQNCDALKTPPIEIRRQGMKNTIAYLLRLVSGSEACYRTKLMLVGLGGAGKTSLMRALMSKDFCAPHLAEEAITDGIDINTWSAKQTGNITLQFSVWDFAGQTLYYNTHQFFLTGRSVYLLLWNVRQGFEHAGLDFWLNSISCHAPTAPIFIVGTHADKVDRSEIPVDVFKKRYPSIVNFHFVSSLNGQGVEILHDSIIAETKKQSYIGEIVPNAWLRLEKDLISQRSTADYLTFETVQKLAKQNAIYDAEVYQAIRFLHDLGSIQYFETALLKSYIIINSQWLVDVMACVVSVKNSIIENGKLHHSSIKDVWHEYPPSIHMWLLRLTEIFDLTFSVAAKDFNYVPCLLDTNQPEFDWPEFIVSNELKESNMFYKFDYLPPGLFNRAQVRLSQYSDSFVIWQNGSLLRKNKDNALMSIISDNIVRVCARGFWPDNILFIIHEVFETLISEAFSGVGYEYKLACRKCISEREPRPHLFSKNILQRAIQSKTVFIQCHKNFHIITMSDIQESMPPEGLEDYDLQFKRSIRMITSSDEQEANILMVLVSKEDYHSTTNLINTPKRIVRDLQKRQCHVWCEPLEEGAPQEQFIDRMTRSEVILIMMSGNFSGNKLCMTLFQLAKTTLRKNMSFLLIDKDYVKSNLGLEVVGKKYINFSRSDVYDQKFVELLHDIETLTSGNTIKEVGGIKPRVFLSYCWDNSRRAFEVGNSKVLIKTAIGWADPRDIKDFLEEKGITCWLDVEMIGPNSLYTEITAGLRDCEMIVACLSSEYAASETCRKEFIFGTQNLNLPVVAAIVGCDHNWIKSEIGLLSVDFPKVSFQTASDTAFEDLYNKVNNSLAITAKNAPTTESANQNINTLASQEDFELIQRKIFRLLCSGFGNEESRMYPRLFFIDIFDISDKEEDQDVGFNLDLSLNNKATRYSLCFRMLCESETGWHTVDDGLLIEASQGDQERLLTLAAPYLHRVTILLKYSQSNNIKLFNQEANKVVSESILDMLAKNAKSWSYIKPIHNAMRTHIINKDIKMKYGGLQSSCLNSGKIVWLCQDHSKKPHISVINTEESHSLVLSNRRMTSDRNYEYDEEDETLVKDDVLINELDYINKEQFSDVDSSTESKKAPNETNNMLDMMNKAKVTEIIPPKEKVSLAESRPAPFFNGGIDHILIPPLQIMPHHMNFESKACIVM